MRLGSPSSLGVKDDKATAESCKNKRKSQPHLSCKWDNGEKRYETIYYKPERSPQLRKSQVISPALTMIGR